jgi:RND family efflux transporter MFP subunit
MSMNMHNKLPDPVSADVYAFDAAGKPGRARFGGRRWLLPVLIVAGLIAAFYAYRAFTAKPAEKPVEASAPQVTVIVPGSTMVADKVSAPGSIAARRDEAVGVQGEGGLVTQVLVDAGQSVQKGQVLARLDRAVQVQQVAQLAASVRQAEADARLAEANLNRAQTLVAKGFISKADIDQRTATRDGAMARVAVARAQLAESQERLARLDIRAPASGLLLSRNIETGQVVGPGSGALFRVAEGGVLEMRAQVAEQDMARLKPGMPATVTPVGSTETFTGKIWLIDPVIDANTRQGIARIALSYNPGLRVGAFARANIAAGEAARPVLPQSAVQADERGSYVMIVGKDNKVERRSITIGNVGDEGVSIASGLNGNERVVASAGAFLRPGEKVEPLLAKSARMSPNVG